VNIEIVLMMSKLVIICTRW